MARQFELRCPDCDASLADPADLYYEPDQDPVPCSNHDHPAFSDPGSAGCLEGCPDTCPSCDEPIDPDWAYERAREWYDNEAYDAAIDAAEDRAEERRYR